MSMKARIESRLIAVFSPEVLEVIDESEQHRGHAGWREGGETHFRVHMVAALFDAMSRIDRQRHVLDCLADELQGPVHALALKLQSPKEAEKT